MSANVKWLLPYVGGEVCLAEFGVGRLTLLVWPWNDASHCESGHLGLGSPYITCDIMILQRVSISNPYLPAMVLIYPHDVVSSYASRILERYLDDHDHDTEDSIIILPRIPPSFDSSGDGPAQADIVGDQDLKIVPIMLPIFSENKKVTIIGAGIGGLYTGLVLQSLRLPFDIFDMDKEVGGRLKTYYFSEKENDYYVCETVNLWPLSN